MVLRRRWVRAAVLHAAILAMAGTGLGLTAAPRAAASCAGPQLSLQQGGSPIAPRREGEEPDEQLLYDVERDCPLVVEAANLTLGCADTPGAAPGCGGPASAPPEPTGPLENAVLNLDQRSQRWTLASIEVGPDLRSRLDVRLPAAARPGEARLLITDPVNGDYSELILVLA